MTTAVRSDLLRDRELAQWLEQRLDSSDTWTASRNFSILITKELLTNIPSCFVDLRTHVKLNVLIAMLYLPKRSVEQWRDEIEDILSLACQDTDEWVQTIAELLKEYPTTSGISFNMEYDGSQFAKTLQELRKILKRQLKGPCNQVLPLDAAYMNKQAVQVTWGVQVQQPSAASAKYFSLKRKPKAAAQRIEFLQKSADVATQMKYKSGPLSSILPIRHKNSVRRMDDDTPLKGIPTQNSAKSAASGFRSGIKPINRQISIPAANQRRLGGGPGGGSGVKLIDINETPQALEKKRRTMEAEEKAAKKAAKEEQKRQREDEKAQKKLQRELKVQQALLQHESQISESSSGVALDNGDLSEEEARKRAPNANDSKIHPTPGYAAELFEESMRIPGSSVLGNSNGVSANVGNTVAPASISVTSSTTITANETHFAAAVLAQTLPLSNAYEGTPSASAVPYFFTPPTPLARGSISANHVTDVTDLTTASTTDDISSVASGSTKRTKAASKRNPDGKAPKKSRGSKKDQPTDVPEEISATISSPIQGQRLVPSGQTGIGIAAQSTSQQLQTSSQIRFQHAGLPATPGIPIATRGLAQMANMFIPQQRIQQQQSVPQQQQQGGQRTILFVPQPTQPSNLGMPASSVNLASVMPIGVAQRVIIQQQPTQMASGPLLASFTPSVIRQATPSAPTNAGTTPAALQTPTIRFASTQPQQPAQAAGTSDDSKKPTFTITKEVMLKAQEMFRTANKLSRPEKALILGFMAGNRENPCPQMGRILTVRLSENQDIQAQADGSSRPVMIETYFQMNYDTGEWKQIRKIRPLREGEGQAA